MTIMFNYQRCSCGWSRTILLTQKVVKPNITKVWVITFHLFNYYKFINIY